MKINWIKKLFYLLTAPPDTRYTPPVVLAPPAPVAMPSPPKRFVIYDVTFKRSTGFGYFTTHAAAQELLDSCPSLREDYEVREA